MGAPVRVELSEDEALVLLDWLARFNAGAPTFDDQAEQRVLWDLEAALEKQLAAVVAPDYAALLERARAAVRDRTD